MGPADLPMKPDSFDHQTGVHNQPPVGTMISAMFEHGTHFEISAGFHEQLAGVSVHLPVANIEVACDHGLLRHWKFQESISIEQSPWTASWPNPIHPVVKLELTCLYVEISKNSKTSIAENKHN